MAHLEAYARLQSAFHTLQLCNRFGKGPKAAVSKLPVELINTIQGYLFDKTCKGLRKKWTGFFRCWECRCKPSDHLTLKECITKYCEYVAKRDGLYDYEDEFDLEDIDHSDIKDYRRRHGISGVMVDEDLDEYFEEIRRERMAEAEARVKKAEKKFSKIKTLTREQMELVNEELENEGMDSDDDDFFELDDDNKPEWQDRHEWRKEAWCDKTKALMESSGGLSSIHEELLRAHFGLEIHISHTTTLRDKNVISDRWIDDEGDDIRTTIAHITLAGSTRLAKPCYPRYYIDSSSCGVCEQPDYLPSETAISATVPIPTQLSAESEACFERALRRLHIQPIQHADDKETTLFASEEDVKLRSGSVAEQQNAAVEGTEAAKIEVKVSREARRSSVEKGHQAISPRLMLLIRARND